MSDRRSFHLHFVSGLGIGFLALAVTTSLAAGSPATENLLVNGDAELQHCANDWTAQSSIPGWRVTRGAAAVLCYSAFALAAEPPMTPANGQPGNALFAAPGADTAMVQIIDVGPAGEGIDDGAVKFHLSGWLGGWRDRPERATLTAVFLDDRGRATGDPVYIANADAHARGNATGLVSRAAHGDVPPGTRRIELTVHFLSGMTSFNNAYADNLSLTLSGAVRDLHRAAAAPARARIPPLDHVFVVMMENTNYSDVIRSVGNSAAIDPGMPFTASLARHGVILDNMWGTYHPSDENFVAMVAGDTFEYGAIYYPNYDLAATHLGDLLEAQGKSWRAYVQNMGTPCNLQSQGTGQDSYSPDDQPFVQFQDVIGDAARCVKDNRDLMDLGSDIASNRLPDFAWIAADNWWNGEGAWYENYDVAYSNVKQDEFLRIALRTLLESAAWKDSRSLLILTWDESGGWGWPDNRVPTILVGSPGLLHEGTVVHDHANGYDLLRTIEAALGVGNLGRFDQFAQPLNTVFADDGVDEANAGRAAHELWPTPSVSTRGSLADTFGQVTTPAAVERGRPLTLVVPAGVDEDTVVNLEPLGRLPGPNSTPHRFAEDDVSVSIPTDRLKPGLYGAWLRRGTAAPHRAPMMASILPPAKVNAENPGVEIVGTPPGLGAAGISIREDSNFIVRYCLPAGVDPSNGWIGIFAAGTPADQLTQDNANVIGNWLKTPKHCGEAQAYAAELTPGQDYEVLLLVNSPQGTSSAVGTSAAFSLWPALPH